VSTTAEENDGHRAEKDKKQKNGGGEAGDWHMRQRKSRP
jgi:hypothetical protein